MTALAIALAFLAAFHLGLYLVACSERDKRAEERDEARATVARQEALLYAILAERKLQQDADVLPFGPVQSGVARRLLRQRNGEGA